MVKKVIAKIQVTARRSLTTNLAFAEWVQVFVDEQLPMALLDRLAHHVHILTTSGRPSHTLPYGTKI